MTRRRQGENFLKELYEGLLVFPAWVGPILAFLCYFALRFLIPGMYGSSDKPGPSMMVAIFAKALALPLTGLILITWVVAECQKRLGRGRRRRLLDKIAMVGQLAGGLRKGRRRWILDGQSGLGSIRGLSWQAFECLVGEAYRRRGYVVQETGSAAGDGGIDLLLTKPGEQVLVQCKQWRTRRVGVKPVRELFGVMTSESATRGILVTCGSFTREARSFADGKPIALVEGPELWELVKSVSSTISSSKPDHRAAPSTSNPTALTVFTAAPARPPPACPKCAAPMILRRAMKGPSAGSRFWGCSHFPRCRGTRNITR